MLESAMVVQLSAALVIKPLPFQNCVCIGIGIAINCEPLAYCNRRRPKRIGLPELKAIPLPAVAVVPKRAGLVAYATPSASITFTASAISASNGALGVV